MKKVEIPLLENSKGYLKSLAKFMSTNPYVSYSFANKHNNPEKSYVEVYYENAGMSKKGEKYFLVSLGIGIAEHYQKFAIEKKQKHNKAQADAINKQMKDLFESFKQTSGVPSSMFGTDKAESFPGITGFSIFRGKEQKSLIDLLELFKSGIHKGFEKKEETEKEDELADPDAKDAHVNEEPETLEEEKFDPNFKPDYVGGADPGDEQQIKNTDYRVEEGREATEEEEQAQYEKEVGETKEESYSDIKIEEEGPTEELQTELDEKVADTVEKCIEEEEEIEKETIQDVPATPSESFQGEFTPPANRGKKDTPRKSLLRAILNFFKN
jgi:hypothetical protein